MTKGKRTIVAAIVAPYFLALSAGDSPQSGITAVPMATHEHCKKALGELQANGLSGLCLKSGYLLEGGTEAPPFLPLETGGADKKP